MKLKGFTLGKGIALSLIFSLITAVPVFADTPNNSAKTRSATVSAFAAGTIIDNGTIQLGINPEGHLNVPGGTPSMSDGTTDVGLRYIPTNGEATSPGCLCEGWGVANADEATGVFSGYANVATDGVINLELQPETGLTSTSGMIKPESQGSAFKSVVTSSGRVKVTQDYKPSSSPNLYLDQVTIENIGETPIGDLRYRRVMDWDIAPNTFSEHVEIHVGNAANVVLADTDGFRSADPLSDYGPYAGSPAAVIHPGDPDHMSTDPSDQGALFDFKFGTLAPGESRTFNIYYGGAETRDQALNALSTVGAEVYSFGIPSNDDGTPALNGPHIFIFAFGEVGGEVVDTIAPTTTLLANSAPVTTGEYDADNINIQLNAEDNPSGSGVDKTFYKVNGGTLQEYTAPFVLSGSSAYTVEYYSQDKAGNVEGSHTVTLTVKQATPSDTVPPVTKASYKPIWATKNGLKYISGYTFTLTATDDLSGVKHTWYQVNGGSWTLYTGPFNAYGTNNLNVDYYSEDHAGNVEAH